MFKKKDAFYMKKFTVNIRKVPDGELDFLKGDLLKKLNKTRKKSELISIEKRIEAIEEVQAERTVKNVQNRRGRKGVKMDKNAVAKFAAVSMIVAAAACVYYIKVNDIRFPDVVDKVADLQK